MRKDKRRYWKETLQLEYQGLKTIHVCLFFNLIEIQFKIIIHQLKEMLFIHKKVNSID